MTLKRKRDFPSSQVPISMPSQRAKRGTNIPAAPVSFRPPHLFFYEGSSQFLPHLPFLFQPASRTLHPQNRLPFQWLNLAAGFLLEWLKALPGKTRVCWLYFRISTIPSRGSGSEKRQKPRLQSPLIPSDMSSEIRPHSPNLDLDKPHIPYTAGQTFIVRRHIPPPPFLPPYTNRHPPFPKNLRKLTQLEYCLSWHPLEGSTCDDDTFSFTITKELRVVDGRGAQIVVANGDLVAKIYDPLYYPAWRNSSERDNVIMRADYDYSREAAAYNELRGPLEGTIIPRYHGSWTCDITVDTPSGPRKRPVRLILMEFIDGVCMQDLDPNDFTEEERSNITVKAMDAERAIAFHGVLHMDFALRNIVCSGNDLRSSDLRVAIIDFNVAIVTRLDPRWPRNDPNQLPYSPIRRWDRHWPHLGEWVPPTREKLNEWLWKHWAGSPLYQPVVLRPGEDREQKGKSDGSNGNIEKGRRE